MPLSMVKVGKRVRILAVNAGRRLQMRLASMGLVPGVEIEVISNNFRGPFIVAVNDLRLVLGRGMAHKIEVE
nr:ferrous iron transport protein A [Desulfobacterales bacterium]